VGGEASDVDVFITSDDGELALKRLREVFDAVKRCHAAAVGSPCAKLLVTRSRWADV
jgi:hypothetical protein